MPIVYLSCVNMAKARWGALIVIERSPRSTISPYGRFHRCQHQPAVDRKHILQELTAHDGAMIISKAHQGGGMYPPVSHNLDIPQGTGLPPALGYFTGF